MVLNKILNEDARRISEKFTEEIVDVTITSPPYFDLKDYGYDGQIGFGQSYENYLNDLHKVFKGVFDCTKSTGTLWVIIDIYRRNDEVVTLPFDFSNKIKDIGWKLQEVIIWEKDKTLPWAHKGQMRNIFEYILVFSKTENYTFNVDKVRDFETLKKWWVRYPERYNPKGKTPTGIWKFEIPTQGSWGKSYKSHFCPLPEKMIEQILKITTQENDVVLDPFSGSGTVPSISQFMRRNYIGFELNREYINMFDKYVKDFKVDRQTQYDNDKKNSIKQSLFEKLIIDLRILKFPRLLSIELKKHGILVVSVFAKKSKIQINNKRAIAKAEYYFFVDKINDMSKLDVMAKKIISDTTLSNFGIEPVIIWIDDEVEFIKLLGDKKIYSYTLKCTHRFQNIIEKKDFKKYHLLSQIKLELNEKDYS